MKTLVGCDLVFSHLKHTISHQNLYGYCASEMNVAESRRLLAVHPLLLIIVGLHIAHIHSVASLFVHRGSEVQLFCDIAVRTVSGRSAEWLRMVDNTTKPITPSANVKFDESDASLFIFNASFADSGQYICLAGNNSMYTHLTIMDSPMSPEKPEVRTVDAYAIEVNWKKITDNSIYTGPITGYLVQVRNTNMTDWTDPIEVMVDGSANSVIVDGLLPYKLYRAKVLAINAVGFGPPSPQSKNVRTDEAAPTMAPLVTVQNYSTAILLNITAPPIASRNGHILGYKMKYHLHSDSRVFDVYIRNFVQSYNVTGLVPYTLYVFKLAVHNAVGTGPWLEFTVPTDEGVPSRPPIVYIRRRTSRLLQVAWEKPVHANGILRGYRLTWRHNYTKSAIRVKDARNFTITNLKPYTEYTIQVFGYTQKGLGEPSALHNGLTDVSGPSAPEIISVTSNSSDTLTVKWIRPRVIYRQIDIYVITYRKNNSDIKHKHNMSNHGHGAYQLQETIKLNEVICGESYEVTVAGITISVFSNVPYIGNSSLPKRVHFNGACSEEVVTHSRSQMALVVSVIVSVLVITLIITSIIVFIRRYARSKYKAVERTDVELTNNGTTPTLGQYVVNEATAIAVDKWAEHMVKMQADSNLGYAQQFDEINELTNGTPWVSAEHSAEVENQNKNRYINIVAYDHSRVVLKRLLGKSQHSDYINANFVDAYNRKHAYIAAQGPLSNTCGDFWRMIWEQRSSVIMMITNLVERGRRKCFQYWPDQGDQQYGHYNVRIISTETMAHYTVRVFAVSHAKGSMMKRRSTNERLVYQYHFTEWPDHGVPEFTLPVLSFITKATAASPEWSGPIVIHCSAGVGRTGTCIVIDSMLQQMKDKGSVDVFSFLAHIRKQRNLLVQTEDQYAFIHSVLLERIESGETELKAVNLQHYLSQLTLSDSDGTTLLEKQYKLITSFKPNKYQLSSALADMNKTKNRQPQLLPVEISRVHLLAKPGEAGSDYINASYMPGYNKDKEFIVTQHPLADTVEDFWRMVWDQNSRTVVLLSDCCDDDFPVFWPLSEGDTMDCGIFTVTMTTQVDQPNHISRDFILQSTQDDYECTTRILHNVSWLDDCKPISKVFELMKTVRRWQRQDEGPVIVVDRYGGSTACTFCALTTLYDQLQRDHTVDVYLTAKLYHLNRPAIFSNSDDLHFLYKAVSSIVDDKLLGPKPSIYLLLKGKGSLHQDMSTSRLSTVYETAT